MASRKKPFAEQAKLKHSTVVTKHHAAALPAKFPVLKHMELALQNYNLYPRMSK